MKNAAKVVITFLVLAAIVLLWPWRARPDTQVVTEDSSPGASSPGLVTTENVFPWAASSSLVTVEKVGDSSFRYMVGGQQQLFIGMGYNPIYRDFSDEERAARYDYDFQMLCEAGVNHITGWDADKGYEQDKFDEITLDYAHKYGIGVVMPFYLPALEDYTDDKVKENLMKEAAIKIARFKNHPALRMWGVGNEVLYDMPHDVPNATRNRIAFGRFYLQLADLFHKLDPNHPVIYREAEDYFIPVIRSLLSRRAEPRPWLLYGMNIYSDELERILDEWPSLGIPGPIIVTEFGAGGAFDGERARGYLSMWRAIRAHPDYVLGGAPYCWTTDGPEPVDVLWGLVDTYSKPVDDTFRQLAEDWRKEKDRNQHCR